MRVSFNRPRQVLSAAALTIAVTVALPAAALADAPRLAACDDLLVTISPAGTTGDARAAAVTAQVLVADVPGWESVTWAVPSTTQLREVLVLHADGTTRSVGGQPAGTARDVLALGFCGSVDTGSADDSDTEVAAGSDTSVVIDPEPAPPPAPQPDPGPKRSTDTTTAASTATSTEIAPASDGPGSNDSAGDGHLDDADLADEPATDAPVDPDDADDAATTTAFGGPIGPTTAPYHDATRLAEVLATPVVDEPVTPGVTLLAASADGFGGMPSRGVAITTDGGYVLALAGLAGGAAAGLVLLLARRRFGTEVPA